MKRSNLKFLVMLLTSVMLVSTSCKKDKDPDPTPGATNYSLGILAGSVNYVLKTSNLKEGTLSLNGNGVEFGGAEFITSGKYIYYYSRAEKKFYQYELNTDGTVTQKAALLVASYVADRAYSQNLIDDNTILVIDAIVWGSPDIKWFTISIPDFVVSASGTASLPTLEKSAGVNWSSNVGKGALHGNKFVMGSMYYDFDGNVAPGAHAVVFDYPSMSNPTLISTDKTEAELGIVSNNGVVAVENGDLYFSTHSGAVWGKPTKDGVYGGILRVKSGENDFDEDYFLDFTEVLGENANIMQLDYVGNGKAIAMLFDDTKVNGWGDLDNDHYFYALVDLATKKVTKYNVPKSNARYGRKPLVDGGKYITYLKSTANSTTNILELDVTGGADSYTKGVLISGTDVKGYSVAKHPAN